MATHSEEASAVADTIVRMRDGHIVPEPIVPGPMTGERA
jgi:ABC-type lipoprotein export system ATPase subunit